jgi:hypothetical protein
VIYVEPTRAKPFLLVANALEREWKHIEEQEQIDKRRNNYDRQRVLDNAQYELLHAWRGNPNDLVNVERLEKLISSLRSASTLF